MNLIFMFICHIILCIFKNCLCYCIVLYPCLFVILYYKYSKIACVIELYCTVLYVIVSEFMSMHSSYEFAKNLQNYVINHKSNLNINLSCCLSGNNRIFNTLICTNFFCSKIYNSSNLSLFFFSFFFTNLLFLTPLYH